VVGVSANTIIEQVRIFDSRLGMHKVKVLRSEGFLFRPCMQSRLCCSVVSRLAGNQGRRTELERSGPSYCSAENAVLNLAT
jgi:hypothetical protein